MDPPVEKTVYRWFFLVKNLTPPSDLMKSAFKFSLRKKIASKWINFEKLKSVDINQNDLIVLEEFDSVEYEYFKEKQKRIISPIVIKYTDKTCCKKALPGIPERTFPIFSQCMRLLTITCTGFNDETKKMIETQILLMSGRYETKWHNWTKILISNTVVTQKYHYAGKYNNLIVSIDWVKDCFNIYQYQFKMACDEEIISKYRLPLFFGLNIALNELSEQETEKLKELIKLNGGTYQLALFKTVLPNTILLCQENQGEKYEYAKKFNIKCIHLKWIYDSLEAGYSLPFNDYDVDKVESSGMATVSEFNSQILNTEMPNTEMKFLRGCAIHAVGFEIITLKLIKNSIRVCGGSYYNHLKPAVNIIIVGPTITEEEFQVLLEKYQNYLVKIDWYIDSLESKTAHSLTNYLVTSMTQLSSIDSKVCSLSSDNSLNDTSHDRSIKISDYLRLLTENRINENTPKINASIHPSQNCKPLVENDDDSPPVAWIPKDISFDSGDEIDENDSDMNKSQNKINEKHSETKENVDQLNQPSEISIEHNDNEEFVYDDDEELMETISKSIKPVLMFSGFPDQIKIKLIQTIDKKLGIRVHDEQIVTDEVTHLILHEAAASEKVVSAIGAGVWILKSSYIMDSLKNGTLMPEKEYQWGLELIGKEPFDNRERVMLSAFQWKCHLDRIKKKLFQDTNVIFMNNITNLNHLISCKNVLLSGGANVYFIDDFFEKETELDLLLPNIHWALIDNKFHEKPLMTIENMKKYIEYFDQNNILIYTQIIPRYIRDGPEFTIEDHKNKFSVKLEALLNSMSNYYE